MIGWSLETKTSIYIANILRVMRGGGKPYQVIGDIEEIAQDTTKTWNDSGLRGKAVGDISTALQSWIPEVEEYGSTVFFERCICEAALRLVAGWMDGNRVETSKGRHDLWRQVADWKKHREDEDEKAKEEYYARMAKEREASYRRDNAAERVNGRACAAANDNVASYVYFITDGEAIKIGKANNPRSRLSGLQTSHHKPLYILALMPGNEGLERTLHSRFYNFRIRGEWFKDCEEIRTFIKASSTANDNTTTAHAA